MVKVIPASRVASTTAPNLSATALSTALAARLRDADDGPPYGSQLEASRRSNKRLPAADSNHYAS